MRDKHLDIYRGLIMIYIIGFIHVIFWAKMVEAEWKSYFLFEMAIIFFITGASHTMSKNSSLFNYYIKRIERVLIPFWVYAIIGLFTVFLLLGFGIQTNYVTATPVDIIIGWLNPFGSHPSNVSYLTWHLWFIPLYCVIMALIPLAYSVFNRIPIGFKWTPLLLLFSCVYLCEFTFDASNLVKNSVFYLFWTYVGFYYPIFKEKGLSVLATLLVSGSSFAVVWVLLTYGPYVSDMQVNKFPPNTLFLFFTIGWFCLLVSLRRVFVWLGNLPLFSKLVDSYSSHGYTYYLYQPFSFLAANMVIYQLLEIETLPENRWKLAILYILFILLFTLVFRKLFYSFEQVKIWKKSSKAE